MDETTNKEMIEYSMLRSELQTAFLNLPIALWVVIGPSLAVLMVDGYTTSNNSSLRQWEGKLFTVQVK